MDLIDRLTLNQAILQPPAQASSGYGGRQPGAAPGEHPLPLYIPLHEALILLHLAEPCLSASSESQRLTLPAGDWAGTLYQLCLMRRDIMAPLSCIGCFLQTASMLDIGEEREARVLTALYVWRRSIPGLRRGR